jgi:hypothetical protein
MHIGHDDHDDDGGGGDTRRIFVSALSLYTYIHILMKEIKARKGHSIGIASPPPTIIIIIVEETNHPRLDYYTTSTTTTTTTDIHTYRQYLFTLLVCSLSLSHSELLFN